MLRDVSSSLNLHRKKKELTLNDSIDRTALLAKPAVDAFRHVDIITRGPPAAVLTFLSLDRDG